LPLPYELGFVREQVDWKQLHVRDASDQEDECSKSLWNDEPTRGLSGYNLSYVHGSCHHNHPEGGQPERNLIRCLLKESSQSSDEGELAVSTPSCKQDESGRQSDDGQECGESDFDVRDLKSRCKRDESNKGRAEDKACRWSHYEEEGIRILRNDKLLECKLDQVRKHLKNPAGRACIEGSYAELHARGDLTL